MKLDQSQKNIAYYHLPGLFEFYELYKLFLPLFREHKEYFYPWCEIGSIYGAPVDCLWGGGRVELADASPREVLALTQEYGVSARLTFSNSLLEPPHLSDARCNALCRLFSGVSGTQSGVIVHSDLLLSYLKQTYPQFYFVSSTTKVITDFAAFQKEAERGEVRYIVPDFRLNPRLPEWESLPRSLRPKVEFLCNECCAFDCQQRKACYEAVSRKNLGLNAPEHRCLAPGAAGGYRFSRAMQNPGFIGPKAIVERYLPMGYSNFKIEGRGLGSALVLEFLLYYMVKPEYQLIVRENIYLDNMLDLF